MLLRKVSWTLLDELDNNRNEFVIEEDIFNVFWLICFGVPAQDHLYAFITEVGYPRSPSQAG